MNHSLIDSRRGEFQRDLLTVAKINVRNSWIFTTERTSAAHLLMDEHSEFLTYFDIEETAFVVVMWHLYNYTVSSDPPTSMLLEQWIVGGAIVTYLRQLHAAGQEAFRREEYDAISRCLAVCERANAKFTSRTGWFPFAKQRA